MSDRECESDCDSPRASAVDVKSAAVVRDAAMKEAERKMIEKKFQTSIDELSLKENQQEFKGAFDAFLYHGAVNSGMAKKQLVCGDCKKVMYTHNGPVSYESKYKLVSTNNPNRSDVLNYVINVTQQTTLTAEGKTICICQIKKFESPNQNIIKRITRSPMHSGSFTSLPPTAYTPQQQVYNSSQSAAAGAVTTPSPKAYNQSAVGYNTPSPLTIQSPKSPTTPMFVSTS